MVHYSLDFTAYKIASWGVFFRCGTPKGCGVKDYKAKALGPKIRTSEDPTVCIWHDLKIQFFLLFNLFLLLFIDPIVFFDIISVTF